MGLRVLIVPLGIATYVFVLAAVVTGLRRVKVKYHKRLALAALVFATLHAALVVFLSD
jgi:hypothetical protein